MQQLLRPFGEPNLMFKNREAVNGFDVAADGQRFIIGRTINEDDSTTNIILNWTAVLKK